MPILSLILALMMSASFAKNYESEGQKFTLEELVTREDVIWGFDFLPDGRTIFTERSGKMLVFDPTTKKVTELTGVPKVYVAGQGGLLDVRVHPEFKQNNKIFFTYSLPVGNGNSTTAVGVAELQGNGLINVKKIFSAFYDTDEDYHYGSRIEFDGKGLLFVTIGERGQRKKSLELNNHVGKIIRIKEDGSAADNNPFSKDPKAKPEIYSIGHRNSQGMMRHPVTGEIWEVEMGPRGGDELNLIKPGANYGWSEVTKGREYYGPKIGVPEKKGVEEPIAFWTPSISPAGMAFYFGDKMPKWKGNIFVATLSGMHLRRLVMDENKVTKQEELLKDIDARFRSVRQGPDGLLYYSTDDGKIVRLKNI